MSVRIPLILFLFCIACGGKKSTVVEPKVSEATPNSPTVAKGFESPNLLGQAIVDAVGKSEAVDDLFPSDALLTLAVDCTGSNPIKREIEKQRKKCRRQLTELPPEMGPVTYERVEAIRDVKNFAAGETKDNCTFKLPITTQRYRHFAKTTMNGRPHPLKEGVRLIKIGDYGWFLYSF